VSANTFRLSARFSGSGFWKKVHLGEFGEVFDQFRRKNGNFSEKNNIMV
jgi:hypothetical protein